jgi:ubiquinone/menaquinone biosynthesis C-methylase UbiE
MGIYENYVFPPIMEWGTAPFRADCRTVLAEARGQVLEIGVGTGANLGSYGTDVVSVTGIEPVDAMLETARKRVLQSPPAFPVTLQVGDARALPFADEAFDSVTAILVFCTIPEPEKAMAELLRVLKPGGRLVFFEHVRSDRWGAAFFQRKLNPVWRKLACGCEITRDTRGLIEAAGFRFEQFREWCHPGAVSLIAPVISGVAIKPLTPE